MSCLRKIFFQGVIFDNSKVLKKQIQSGTMYATAVCISKNYKKKNSDTWEKVEPIWMQVFTFDDALGEKLMNLKPKQNYLFYGDYDENQYPSSKDSSIILKNGKVFLSGIVDADKASEVFKLVKSLNAISQKELDNNTLSQIEKYYNPNDKLKELEEDNDLPF
jgi:hypothetical protein